MMGNVIVGAIVIAVIAFAVRGVINSRGGCSCGTCGNRECCARKKG